jgi:hypothetical protein
LVLRLSLGPGAGGLRGELQRIIAGYPSLFNKATSKVYPKWWSFHIEKWLTSAQFEELDLTELKSVAAQHFDRFHAEQLPRMRGIFDTLAESATRKPDQ